MYHNNITLMYKCHKKVARKINLWKSSRHTNEKKQIKYQDFNTETSLFMNETSRTIMFRKLNEKKSLELKREKVQSIYK